MYTTVEVILRLFYIVFMGILESIELIKTDKLSKITGPHLSCYLSKNCLIVYKYVYNSIYQYIKDFQMLIMVIVMIIR